MSPLALTNPPVAPRLALRRRGDDVIFHVLEVLDLELEMTDRQIEGVEVDVGVGRGEFGGVVEAVQVGSVGDGWDSRQGLA